MPRIGIGLVCILGLIGSNLWQYFGHEKTIQHSLSQEMMSFVSAVDNVISLYDKDNRQDAAIQIAIAGGELQAISTQLSGVTRQNASFLAEFFRTNAVHVLNNDSTSPVVISYFRQAKKIVDTSRRNPTYDTTDLPTQLALLVKEMPGI